MELFDTITQIKKPDFVASLENWKEFVRGHIWNDISKELSSWLADTWELLEDVDDPIEAAKLRGRARTIREMLNLPNGIMEMIEDERKEN